ncbi:MAG: hypothetical protein J6C30_02300 [Lentisphaeria bacterium]|nr:hypothetical protein [Lentisphaeria bacterium]
MKEKCSPGRRPVTHHARGSGRVRDAAFFRRRKSSGAVVYSAAGKSMPDQPSG